MTTVVAPAWKAGGLLRSILAWSALVAFETLAQAALKAAGAALSNVPFGTDFALAASREPWVYAGAVGYLGAFVAWMAILDKVPLSRGFPLTSIVAVSIIATSVLAFGETLGLVRGAGVGLILFGLVMLGNEAA